MKIINPKKDKGPTKKEDLKKMIKKLMKIKNRFLKDDQKKKIYRLKGDIA